MRTTTASRMVQDGATLLHVVAGCKGVHEFSTEAFVHTARELLQHGFSLVAKDKVLDTSQTRLNNGLRKLESRSAQ